MIVYLMKGLMDVYEGEAVIIPLELWQDPQSEVVLKISDRNCKVYFGCWDDNGEPTNYLGKITFKSHFGARYFYSEFIPYKVENANCHSYILEVKESGWLQQCINRQLLFYANTQNPNTTWDRKPYQHFIVKGHDVYVEVIASELKVEKVYKNEAGDLAYLIEG